MDHSLNSVFEKHRDEGEDIVYVVNPDRNVLTEVHQVFSDTGEEYSEVRILGEAGRIKDMMGDFLIASKIGGLVESNYCEIRTHLPYERNPLVASQAGISFWTESADEPVAIFDTLDSKKQSVIELLNSDWQSANPFSRRTPGLPRLRETAEAELGEDFRRDFDSLLSEFNELRGTGDELNELSLALLAAAKNELLFYDLSRWGEDAGLASKATFTRQKQRLEDIGVITTSKQPIDIGRPRLRLHLVKDDIDISPAILLDSDSAYVGEIVGRLADDSPYTYPFRELKTE